MALSVQEPFTTLNRDAALAHVMALIDRYWKDFEHARPTQPGIDKNVRDLLDADLPENPMDVIDALNDADNILDKSLSQPRPRFFAFVGSSGLEMGVLADVLSSCHDINLAVYAGAANLVEEQALRWIAELIGFPSRFGAFTSGGMLSNLTALTAAREYAMPGTRVNGIQQPCAIYISHDAHSSIERAVEVLGIGSKSIRDIPLDSQRRMDVAILKETLERDIQSGVKPIAIVANAGTTLTGAVDPIREIANVAKEHRIWVHVDGAYGMPAASTDMARAFFDGLAEVHSITIDAHKWLFLPKPCGVLLVRDQEFLRAAFTHNASYIPKDSDPINPVDWTLEYSRPLQALKVWLAFRTYGASAFRNAIQRNLEQAQHCAQRVRESASLELLLDPQLSVVLFRHVPTSPDIDINAHNMQLVHELQADGRVYVAGATVDGMSCLRTCFVNYRTHIADVDVLVDVVNELGAKLEAQHA